MSPRPAPVSAFRAPSRTAVPVSCGQMLRLVSENNVALQGLSLSQTKNHSLSAKELIFILPQKLPFLKSEKKTNIFLKWVWGLTWQGSGLIPNSALKRSFTVGLGGLYEVLGIEPGSAAFKVSPLPTVLISPAQELLYFYYF